VGPDLTPVRPAIARAQDLATRYPDLLELIDPLPGSDGSEGADADGGADRSTTQVAGRLPGSATGDAEIFLPPALRAFAEEFGGLRIRGADLGLEILVTERSELGPFTLLEDPLSFTPVYEGEDVAAVVALDPAGTPGAVYGIDEDLSFTLLAGDLGEFVVTFVAALDRAIEETLRADGLDPVTAARTGASPDPDAVADALRSRALVPSAEGTPVRAFEHPDTTTGLPEALPPGTVWVADLRRAALGTRVEPMEVDVPADVVELGLSFAADGRVLALRYL
jgi:hypothetical protein